MSFQNDRYTNDLYSRDFAWEPDEMSAYHEQYRTVSRADSLLARVAIDAILSGHNTRPLLKQLNSGLILGAGGVPRGAGILEPTLAETAFLRITDSTKENVDETRRIFEELKKGRSSQRHWYAHERDMEKHNFRWRDAIGNAALRASFDVQDIHTVEPHSAEGVGMEYVAESMLSDRNEYRQVMRRFTDASDRLVYMAYSVNSHGYVVGDRRHPAYPVSVDEAAELIEQGGFELLHDPHEGFAPASPELRQENDTHSYDGFAVIVAERK